MKLKLTPRKTISLFVVGILLCSLGSYALGQSATSRNLYLNDLPHAVYYTLTNDGTYYWATRYDGGTYYYSTNASYTYNEAASDLTHTYQQTILITGPAWTITAPLLVHSYETLQIDTVITLGNGADCAMIKNANPDTYNVYTLITGSGYLNGNYLNNAGTGANGCGIYFEQSATIPGLTNWVRIIGLEIVNCNTYCVWFDAEDNYQASYFWIEDCLLEGGDYAGLYISNAYDVHISTCHIGGNLAGLKLEGVSSIYAEHMYINQGMDITNCGWGTISEFRVDIGISRNGINLNGTQRLCISDGNINTYNPIGTGTYAIVLGSYSGTHCKDLSFNNIILTGPTYTSSVGAQDSFDYGILEASSSQDYNTYTNINGQYCTNYGIKTLGSHSHGAVVWNASSYVAAF